MSSAESAESVLNTEQKTVLDQIFAAGWKDSTWPVFGLLVGPLDRLGIDLQVAVENLIPKYVQRSGSGPKIQLEESIRLTMFGMNEVSKRELFIPQFMCILAYCVSIQQRFQASLDNLSPKVSSAEIVDLINRTFPAAENRQITTRLGLLKSLIEDDQCIWFTFNPLSSDEWTLVLANEIRIYRGVDRIEEYLRKSPLGSTERTFEGVSSVHEFGSGHGIESSFLPSRWHRLLSFSRGLMGRVVEGVIIAIIGGLAILFFSRR